MKLIFLFKGVKKETIRLTKKQLFSVTGKDIQIHCFYGVLWITWPKRGERILTGGQTFRVSSRGKVCIVALSNAFFQISKRKWYANKHTHGESGAKNGDTDIIPFPFKTILYGWLQVTRQKVKLKNYVFIIKGCLNVKGDENGATNWDQ